MKFTVIYVEHCSQSLRVFDSYEAALQFIGSFTLKHLESTDDNFIDAVIKGEPIVTAPSMKVEAA